MLLGQRSSNMQLQPTHKHAHFEENANKTLKLPYTEQYITSTGMQVKSFPLIVLEFVKSTKKTKIQFKFYRGHIRLPKGNKYGH